MLFILITCFTLGSSIPSDNKISFPYDIKSKHFFKQENNDVKMEFFSSKNGDVQDRKVQSQHLNINMFDQRPRITRFINNQVPEPTSNPFLTKANVTHTTGIELPTIITTITSQSTTIENSTLIDGFTVISKYTETFVKDQGLYVLTFSKIQDLIPTQVNYTTAVNTNFITSTLTVSKIISLTHTIVETITSQLSTTSYTLTGDEVTISETGIIITDHIIKVTNTTFAKETNTEIYTKLSKTYTWTLYDCTIYTITRPEGFTKTLVSPGVTVTVSGDVNVTTHSAKITQTNVTLVHTYTVVKFPSATEIPSPEFAPDFYRDVLTFTRTQSKLQTDVAYVSTASCEKNGVLPTWTLAPTYISTFISDPRFLDFTLTKTNILQRVVTEIEDKCNDIIVKAAEIMTDVLTVTNVSKQVYTHTMIGFESTYLSPKKTKSIQTYISNKAELDPRKAYTTVVMTMITSMAGKDAADITFLNTYGTSYTQTSMEFYTTVMTYTITDLEESYDTYIPIESNVALSTLSITRLAKNEEILTPVKRIDSICTNYLGTNTTSISNTVIYTYVDYFTLVTFVNIDNTQTTVSELGVDTSINIEAVNIMQSHSSTSIQTISSTDGTAILDPGSSITNSLLRTKSYTATYIQGVQ